MYIAIKKIEGRPLIDITSKRWKREGAYYKLFKPDYEKDRQFFTAEIKAVKPQEKEFDPQNDRLYISGIANANIADRVCERLEPRGIDVANYLKNSQLLAHHDYRNPVGSVEEIDIQEDGIHFRGWVGDPAKAQLTEMQKEIRSLVMQRILKTVSVGFIPKKIRAPLFNDEGKMEEPAVVEDWELLEISIVSVPANQDSIFQIRSFENEIKNATVDSKVASTDKELNDKSNNKTLVELLDELTKESMVIQSLIFVKEMFTKEEAIKWAKDHGFKFEGVDETEDSYRIRQENPEDFKPNSFRTIDITKGVQAVIGKLKEKNMAGKENTESNQKENFEGEVLTLLRSIEANSKRGLEMTETLMQKANAKPNSNDGDEDDTSTTDEEKKPKKPCKDEDGKTVVESNEKELVLEKRISSIETSIVKLAGLLEIILKKVS
jgi:HK97 family phage prohead protease